MKISRHLLAAVVFPLVVAPAHAASFQNVVDGSTLYGSIWYEEVDTGKNTTGLNVWYVDNASNAVNLSSITFSYSNKSGPTPAPKTYTLTAPSFGFGPVSVGGNGASFGAVTNYTVASPVPEPETYALMLAGLGVVGWAARRRKQGAAAPAQALPA